MDFELKRLTDSALIEEWIELSLLSKPGNADEFHEEIFQSVEKKAKSLNHGIPFYFELDGHIIAASFIRRTEYDTVRTKSLTILHMAVKKEYRGKGIGKLMILKLFDQIKKFKMDYALAFSVDAPEFYRKCKMTEWGRIHEFTEEKTTRYFFYKRF